MDDDREASELETKSIEIIQSEIQRKSGGKQNRTSGTCGEILKCLIHLNHGCRKREK